MKSSKFNVISWALRIIAAVIMLQTLIFKFTAAPESVYIFSKLGLEPWGRIATGCFELLASILILIPRTTGIGALLAVGIMSGALISHLTVLGIEVQGDNGELFILALVVFAVSATLVVMFRKQLLPFYSIIDKKQVLRFDDGQTKHT